MMRKFVLYIILMLSFGLCFGDRFFAYQEHQYEKILNGIPEHPLKIRRDTVINRLKSFHSGQQAEIIGFLENLMSSGQVYSFEPLWIADIIIFHTNIETYDYIRAIYSNYSFSIDNLQYAEISDILSTDEILSLPPDTVYWNLDSLDIPIVWKTYGSYGSGVLVATLDTGTEPWHKEFSDKIWNNPKEGIVYDSTDADTNGYIDDIWGFNFYDTTSHPYDDRGHGTHVCGTILGKHGIGIAPDADILSVKVLNHRGRGYPSDVWRATQYVTAMDAQVANYSIGWRDTSTVIRNAWRTVMKNAITAGLIIVVAAGNEGGRYGAPRNLRLPGEVPEVITVGAVDTILNLAPFSSVGPVEWPDYTYPSGLLKPDIVAPGVSIYSACPSGNYYLSNGTSMAAPHITGICALLKQFYPEITHDEIKAAIESSAVDKGPFGKDSLYGSGLVDLFEAYNEIGDWNEIDWSSTKKGTLIVEPFSLRFFGDSGTIRLPDSSERLIFFCENYEPETVNFNPSETLYSFSLSAATEFVIYTGIMDFETGDPIDAMVIFNDDTVEVDGFDEISIANFPTMVWATAEGYSMDSFSIDTDDECLFLFLHSCINFEDAVFTAHTGDWEWGDPTSGPKAARSGDNLWATSLADTYSNSSDSWLKSPWYDVDSSAALFIWQWFYSEATKTGFWDGGNVSANFGDGWEVIYPIGDYTCWLDDYNKVMPWQAAFSGVNMGNQWHQRIFDLQIAESCSVRIGFHFSSDDNTPYDGWYIDDFCLAKRTVREPIITDIIINRDTVWALAYGVSASLAEIELNIGDTLDLAMDQLSCDTFMIILTGDPGDTITFQVKATDEDGRTDTQPPETTLIAIIPPVNIIEAKNVNKTFNIKQLGNTIVFQGENALIEIFDTRGRKIFEKKITKNEILSWQPEISGIYIIRIKDNSSIITRKVKFIK